MYELPAYPIHQYTQWRRKLKNFERDGEHKFVVKGGTPSKTHRFWPICLLPMEDFASFLIFLSFSLFFLPPRNFRGDVPPLKILRRTCPPASTAYEYTRCIQPDRTLTISTSSRKRHTEYQYYCCIFMSDSLQFIQGKAIDIEREFHSFQIGKF